MLGNTLDENVLMLPIVETGGTLWLQPAHFLITTGFSYGWHLLLAHCFSPLVSSFLKQLIGVGKEKKHCGEYPQRAWV